MSRLQGVFGSWGESMILRHRVRASRITLGVILLGLCSCTPQGDPTVDAHGLQDLFDRTELGPLWHKTGGNYDVRDGKLYVRGARNHPLWLRRVLPTDVQIDFDVRSESPSGDIKVEVFGDGRSFAKQESYTATSYVIVFGGWNNSLNIIARLDEHGSDRVMGPRRPIDIGRTYHVTIQRKGGVLTVFLDGQKFMQMDDRDPLVGRGHDHFAFNNWESELWFDNLKIAPL